MRPCEDAMLLVSEWDLFAPVLCSVNGFRVGMRWQHCANLLSHGVSSNHHQPFDTTFSDCLAVIFKSMPSKLHCTVPTHSPAAPKLWHSVLYVLLCLCWKCCRAFVILSVFHSSQSLAFFISLCVLICNSQCFHAGEGITIAHCPSFLEYISYGFEVCFHVAVDFTASNGMPNYPTSLHHLYPPGELLATQFQAIVALRALPSRKCAWQNWTHKTFSSKSMASLPELHVYVEKEVKMRPWWFRLAWLFATSLASYRISYLWWTGSFVDSPLPWVWMLESMIQQSLSFPQNSILWKTRLSESLMLRTLSCARL